MMRKKEILSKEEKEIINLLTVQNTSIETISKALKVPVEDISEYIEKIDKELSDEERLIAIEKKIDQVNDKMGSGSLKTDESVPNIDLKLSELAKSFDLKLSELEKSFDLKLSDLENRIGKSKESSNQPLINRTRSGSNTMKENGNEKSIEEWEGVKTCKRCGENVTSTSNTKCRYHRGKGSWDISDYYWTCCGAFYYKLLPGHQRTGDSDLIRDESGKFVPDHSSGCQERDTHDLNPRK